MTTSWLRRYRFPLGWYGGALFWLLAVQHVASDVLREDAYRWDRWLGLRWYLDGWSQFDGPEYLEIATVGYSYTPGVRSNIVWFPLYPLLLRFTDRLVGDPLVAGVVVSAAAGAVAACLYWAWLREKGFAGRALVLGFLVLALYPYGWYLYGVVHSDSLFLALAVGAFLLVERRHLVWAGVVGAAATATRPTGMALLPALAVFGLIRDGVLTVPDEPTGLVRRFAIPTQLDRTRLRAASFGPLLALGGVGAWMTYLWVRFGDPIAFVTNQRTYHPGDLPLLKRELLVRWRDFGDDPTYTLTITAQAIVVGLILLSVPAVSRRFGFAYGLFLAVLVAIPTVSTENFMGSGRYMMAAFPAYALWGERLAEQSPRVQVAATSCSAIVVTLLAAAFSRSWYLT